MRFDPINNDKDIIKLVAAIIFIVSAGVGIVFVSFKLFIYVFITAFVVSFLISFLKRHDPWHRKREFGIIESGNKPIFLYYLFPTELLESVYLKALGLTILGFIGLFVVLMLLEKFVF